MPRMNTQFSFGVHIMTGFGDPSRVNKSRQQHGAQACGAMIRKSRCAVQLVKAGLVELLAGRNGFFIAVTDAAK